MFSWSTTFPQIESAAAADNKVVVMVVVVVTAVGEGCLGFFFLHYGDENVQSMFR